MMKKSEFSPAKPARNKDDLIIGTHPHLFNPDRTRYGGQTVVPEQLLAIKEEKKRKEEIAKFAAIMAAKPLTDEEKQQRDEWDELIFGPEPLGSMDDNVADDMIAWAEGHGKFPDGQENPHLSSVKHDTMVENMGSNGNILA